MKELILILLREQTKEVILICSLMEENCPHTQRVIIIQHVLVMTNVLKSVIEN